MSAGIINPRLEYLAREVFPSLSHVFYMTLIAFSAIGAWAALKQLKERFNYGLFLITLYSFGFFILLLIIEAQSRYKIMIIPCLCILAGYGASKVADLYKKKAVK
jgi:asparagine N-glycosylation enzyme membrane subunit Stt3